MGHLALRIRKGLPAAHADPDRGNRRFIPEDKDFFEEELCVLPAWAGYNARYSVCTALSASSAAIVPE